MTHSFKPGDTVALKSGGHAMTVSDVAKPNPEDIGGLQTLLSDLVYVVWIDESGKWREEGVAPECLTPITRKAIHIDDATIRHVWVFADTGQPIADHIAMRV